MPTIIVLGIVIVPAIMSGTCFALRWFRSVYETLALVCAIVSFSTVSLTTYNVISSHTVFMTTIHSLFINPLFLIPSAYLGLYVIHLLYTAVWGKLHVRQ